MEISITPCNPKRIHNKHHFINGSDQCKEMGKTRSFATEVRIVATKDDEKVQGCNYEGPHDRSTRYYSPSKRYAANISTKN